VLLPVAVTISLVTGSAPSAADLKLLLPQTRTAFQINEWIDVSVVRSSSDKLVESDLTLTLTGQDGSSITATFAVTAVPVRGKEARATEHLHVNGWLLRPGKYTLEAASDGATAKTDIEVYSHLRQSNFRLINWGRAKGAQQLPQGEDSLGFNTFYGHYANDDN